MRHSFNSYLSQTLAYNEMPEKIEEEILSGLVQQLLAGDLSVSHTIINGHMRLGMAIVSDFANPRQSDDLVGEALLCLVGTVEACGREPSRLHDTNITPYLAVHMRGALKKFIAEDRVFHMKKRTFHHKLAKGEINIDDFAKKSVVHNIEDISGDILPMFFNTPVARRENVAPEFTEILQLAIHTEGERRVITLRAQGYNHTEIAPIMNLSIRRIGQINAEVEARFDALCG